MLAFAALASATIAWGRRSADARSTVSTEMRLVKARRVPRPTARRCGSTIGVFGSRFVLKVGPGAGAGAQRPCHRDLARLGLLAIDAPALDPNARRPQQHAGIGIDAKQPRGVLGQLLHAEEGVSLLLGLGEDEGRGGLGTLPESGGRPAAIAIRSGRRPDPLHLGQAVGVAVEDRDRPLAVAASIGAARWARRCGA